MEQHATEIASRGPSTLFVIPCSGDKAEGGASSLGGKGSLVDLLPNDLARRLGEARHHLAARCGLDESRLLPAWQRYVGNLYVATEGALGHAVRSQHPVVIISGGYGLVVAEEPIGKYNRVFSLADWPPGLLEACLVTVTRRLGVDRVLAFCARTSDYAKLVRRVKWHQVGVEAVLVLPDLRGAGGAQVLVPRASGEALKAALEGSLTTTWHSADGTEVRTERLP